MKLTQQKSSAENAVLKEQLKKLEAKRISDIAATKRKCQLDYQSLLNTRFEQMVPISDAQYEIDKWKATSEKESRTMNL